MTQSKTTRNQIRMPTTHQSVSSLAEMHKKMPPKVPKIEHGMPIKKLHQMIISNKPPSELKGRIKKTSQGQMSADISRDSIPAISTKEPPKKQFKIRPDSAKGNREKIEKERERRRLEELERQKLKASMVEETPSLDEIFLSMGHRVVNAQKSEPNLEKSEHATSEGPDEEAEMEARGKT